MDIQEIYKQAVASSIWRVAPVTQESQIRLTNWSIKQTNDGNYFVGTREDGTGRVSTQIVTFDESTKKGITKSGRVYELVGQEGYSSNGEYVWSYYKEANKLTEI